MNQAQEKAARIKNGPCLVLAGPGSGKTRTIVNRIRFLIEEYKVRPEEILVVTFTRYAASEMKSRLCEQAGESAAAVTAGTFHGIYYGILKWAYRIGSGNILSEEEKYQILRAAVAQQKMEVFDEEDFLEGLVSEIGVIKNNGIAIEEFHSKKCDSDAFYEIYKAYERQKKKLKKIDFDDMLLLCRNLFLTHPDILKQWQKKFRYILIDEFQDINRIQYDVIKMLALPENNLFVVGDDDQAIYGFRGADSKIMFEFLKDFPKAEQIFLNTNYRSTANIVNNSLKVIEKNTVRFKKKLHAAKEKGATVHIQEVKDPVEESKYIVREIERQIEKGVLAEQIAVLFRVHTDARPLAECFLEHKIAFQMREYLPNLYSHFIGKDIQAYFHMAQGSRLRAEFLQIMNRPKRYLSRESLTQGEVSFEELRKFYFDKEWMQDRIDQLEWDLKMLSKMAPYAAIQYMRKKIGYDDFLRDYAKIKQIQAADLFEILSEIEEAARPFSTLEEWFRHVEEYTEALRRKEQKKKEEQKGIQLMTIHAAKGLEFDTVFIIGANEGQIPYKKAKSEEETEEERRLFYVAMTRAKEVLQICYVKQRNGKETAPSRFVNDLLKSV